MQERGGDVHSVLDPERPAGRNLGAQLVSSDDVGGRALKGGNLTEDLVHSSISESRDGAQPDAGRVMRNELPGNGGGWANSSAAGPGSSVQFRRRGARAAARKRRAVDIGSSPDVLVPSMVISSQGQLRLPWRGRTFSSGRHDTIEPGGTHP